MPLSRDAVYDLIAIAKGIERQGGVELDFCYGHTGRGNDDRPLGNIAGGFDAAAAIGEPHYSIIRHGLSDLAGEAGTIGSKSLPSIKAELALPLAETRFAPI